MKIAAYYIAKFRELFKNEIEKNISALESAFFRFEETSLDIFINTISGMSGAAADALYRIQAPCYASKLNL